MTDKEKAKAYDEALERAKDYHKQLIDEDNPEWASEIEKIFPELKESEDERIRKRIIHALHGDVLDMEETNKALAWLEKQGEKKSQRMISAEAKEAMYDKPAWSEDDEKIITGIINDIQKRLEDCHLEQLAEIYFKEIDWLKSLKVRI